MAETSGLLNRRGGFTPTEGSNPSVSARALVNRTTKVLGDTMRTRTFYFCTFSGPLAAWAGILFFLITRVVNPAAKNCRAAAQRVVIGLADGDDAAGQMAGI